MTIKLGLERKRCVDLASETIGIIRFWEKSHIDTCTSYGSSYSICKDSRFLWNTISPRTSKKGTPQLLQLRGFHPFTSQSSEIKPLSV